jgi:hypothetical protein
MQLVPTLNHAIGPVHQPTQNHTTSPKHQPIQIHTTGPAHQCTQNHANGPAHQPADQVINPILSLGYLQRDEYCNFTLS